MQGWGSTARARHNSATTHIPVQPTQVSKQRNGHNTFKSSRLGQVFKKTWTNYDYSIQCILLESNYEWTKRIPCCVGCIASCYGRCVWLYVAWGRKLYWGAREPVRPSFAVRRCWGAVGDCALAGYRKNFTTFVSTYNWIIMRARVALIGAFLLISASLTHHVSLLVFF